MPSNRPSEYVKPKLTELKEETSSSTEVLFSRGRNQQTEVSKKTEDLTPQTDQITDTPRAAHPTTRCALQGPGHSRDRPHSTWQIKPPQT